MVRRPPGSTLFPYTPLFLSRPSVRPAGRTFLALGAILVPANVAAAYTFLLADGPLPQALFWLVGAALSGGLQDRKSTRLNSSHANISYAVFCLQKKTGPRSC